MNVQVQSVFPMTDKATKKPTGRYKASVYIQFPQLTLLQLVDAGKYDDGSKYRYDLGQIEVRSIQLKSCMYGVTNGNPWLISGQVDLPRDVKDELLPLIAARVAEIDQRQAEANKSAPAGRRAASTTAAVVLGLAAFLWGIVGGNRPVMAAEPGPVVASCVVSHDDGWQITVPLRWSLVGWESPASSPVRVVVSSFGPGMALYGPWGEETLVAEFNCFDAGGVPVMYEGSPYVGFHFTLQ